MLFNEFLKEHRKVEEQEANIAQLKSAAAKQEATAAELKSRVAQQQKRMEFLATQMKSRYAKSRK